MNLHNHVFGFINRNVSCPNCNNKGNFLFISGDEDITFKVEIDENCNSLIYYKREEGCICEDEEIIAATEEIIAEEACEGKKLVFCQDCEVVFGVGIDIMFSVYGEDDVEEWYEKDNDE
jgi:hypothetical protein